MARRRICGPRAMLRLSAGIAALTSAALANAQANSPLDQSGLQDQPPAEQQPQQSQEEGDLVVTATRQSTTLSKVPVSITVLDNKQLEIRGVKQFTDIVRLTPGVALNTGFGGSNNISIRGVSSQAGASTTGIYIDDSPIQVRQVGYASGVVFPIIFDLERVEVLRGPQGTLFGAGSEGGTIRFIQTAPSVERYTIYARAEGSRTSGAAGSYEAGAAVGGPIIADRLGFRLSAFYRRDGGYIDRVPGSFTLNDASGTGYGDAIGFTPTGEGEKNVNSQNSLALRGALKAIVTDDLTVTPSVFYQRQTQNDVGNSFLLGASAAKDGRFVVPLFEPAPATPGGLTELTLPQDQSGTSSLFIPSLAVEWNLGQTSFYSTTSYVEQKKRQHDDQTLFYSVVTTDQIFPLPGAKAQNLYRDNQEVFTQEVRLQSSNPNARLKWVLGGFYSSAKQRSIQYTESNFFASATSFYGIPVASDGDPFGPGYTSYQNAFGVPLINGSGTYAATARVREHQIAAFAQLDFRIFERLTLVGGMRVSQNKLNYSLASSGAENNLNPPFGAPCPDGGLCSYGSGAFAPAYPTGRVRNKETAVLPKVGVNFQANRDNLLYASLSKGFRPGGAQITLPSGCNGDLASYGYVDANGNPASPLTYNSDSVWSYEGGVKSRLFNGKLRIAASGYVIKWKNIQSNLALPVCGYSFVDNLGSATIKGGDLDINVSPFRGLNLNAAIAYTDASLDDGLLQPDGGAIFTRGSAVENSGAPWNVVLGAEYSPSVRGDYEPYVRGDYTHANRARRTGRTDPRTFNYDPLLPPQTGTDLVNLRLGVRYRSVDLSLFVNNVFDTRPLLNMEHQTGQYLWAASTLRPRTMGLTASFRQ